MREDIDVARNIARLRKEQGLTQEDLAAYLGVTKASVSKWETEQSFPDIAQLPRLATYFGVSIDDLMGYAPQMSKEQIKRTYMRLRDKFTREPFDQVHASCKEVVRDFWSCPPLLVQMAVLYLNYLGYAPEGDVRDAFVQEAEELCQRAKRMSTESSVVRQANAIEAMCVLGAGHPQQAIDLLEGSVQPSLGEQNVLSQALLALGRAEDAERCLQVGVYQAVIGMMNDLPQLANMCGEDSQRLEELYSRMMSLIDIFNVEKIYVNCAAAYLVFAAVFVRVGNEQRAYECLDHYVHACGTMEFPVKLTVDSFFDKVGPWLDDLDLGNVAPRDTRAIKQGMVTGLAENPAFASLADQSRFKGLVADLKARLA